MNSQQIKELMDRIGVRYSTMHLTIPIPDGPSDEDVEKEIIGLKNLGYLVMIHESHFGKELVVTDKT